MTAVEVGSRPQSKEGKLIASNTLHSVLLLSIDNSKSLAFLAAVVISVLCSWELEAKALELDESGFRFAMLVLSRVQLFVTLWTTTCQSPLSMGFLGMNTGEGCHPSPGDLLDAWMEPSLVSPVLAGRFFTTNATWLVIIRNLGITPPFHVLA